MCISNTPLFSLTKRRGTILRWTLYKPPGTRWLGRVVRQRRTVRTDLNSVGSPVTVRARACITHTKEVASRRCFSRTTKISRSSNSPSKLATRFSNLRESTIRDSSSTLEKDADKTVIICCVRLESNDSRFFFPFFFYLFFLWCIGCASGCSWLLIAIAKQRATWSVSVVSYISRPK